MDLDQNQGGPARFSSPLLLKHATSQGLGLLTCATRGLDWTITASSSSPSKTSSILLASEVLGTELPLDPALTSV